MSSYYIQRYIKKTNAWVKVGDTFKDKDLAQQGLENWASDIWDNVRLVEQTHIVVDKITQDNDNNTDL